MASIQSLQYCTLNQIIEDMDASELAQLAGRIQRLRREKATARIKAMMHSWLLSNKVGREERNDEEKSNTTSSQNTSTISKSIIIDQISSIHLKDDNMHGGLRYMGPLVVEFSTNPLRCLLLGTGIYAFLATGKEDLPVLHYDKVGHNNDQVGDNDIEETRWETSMDETKYLPADMCHIGEFLQWIWPYRDRVMLAYINDIRGYAN